MSTDRHGRPEPDGLGGELDTLVGFLEFLRATLAWKTHDLGDDALETTLPPSGMTLGGMLHHLAFVEDYWFGCRLSGTAPAAPWDQADWDVDPDWDWHVADRLDAETIRERWSAAVEASRARLRLLLVDGDLDTIERDARAAVNVRWVLVHMIEEYARHAGHADLIREAIDGLVGE